MPWDNVSQDEQDSIFDNRGLMWVYSFQNNNRLCTKRVLLNTANTGTMTAIPTFIKIKIAYKVDDLYKQHRQCKMLVIY
jgi:hypothetical protein